MLSLEFGRAQTFQMQSDRVEAPRADILVGGQPIAEPTEVDPTRALRKLAGDFAVGANVRRRTFQRRLVRTKFIDFAHVSTYR